MQESMICNSLLYQFIGKSDQMSHCTHVQIHFSSLLDFYLKITNLDLKFEKKSVKTGKKCSRLKRKIPSFMYSLYLIEM